MTRARQSARSATSGSVRAVIVRLAPDPRRAKILAVIKASGLSPRSAALSVGVPKSTFYDWCNDGSTFRDEVNEAEAIWERRMSTQLVRAAALGSWRSALAALERRFPARWGPHQAIDLTVDREPDEEEALDRQYPTAESLDAALVDLGMQALASLPDADLEALLEEAKARRPTS